MKLNANQSAEDLAYDIEKIALQDACEEIGIHTEQISDFVSDFYENLPREIHSTNDAHALYNGVQIAAKNAVDFYRAESPKDYAPRIDCKL